MNKIVKWIPVAIIVILIIVSVFIVQSNQPDSSSVTKTQSTGAGTAFESKPAIDFELANLQGEKVKLSDYKGRKILVNFWATWCPPCQSEMADIQKLHENYPEYVVLSINEDPENDVQGFVNQYGLTFPVLIDANYQVQTEYQINAYPTSFFIDEEGVVQRIVEGGMKYDEFESVMADL